MTLPFRAKVGVTDDNDQTYALVNDWLTDSRCPGREKYPSTVVMMRVILRTLRQAIDDFGEAETYIIRPAVTWTITEDLETTLIFERGEDRGDQAIPFTNFDSNWAPYHLPVPGDFKVRTHTNPDDPVGQFNNARWMHLISETTYDVNFGNGTITNIASLSAGRRRVGW